MLFEKFQDCHHSRHLGYWNWTMQQFWISMSPRCLPWSFASTWLTVWEEIWFEEFQAGGHLGHWNRWTLAILKFHNTPMPPIMFKHNQIYHLVADVIWKFSRWLPWWPPWIWERNHFSNSKSLMMPRCLPSFPLNPSYCSEADNNWRFSRWPDGDVVWKFSRWLTWQPSWILERNDFSDS